MIKPQDCMILLKLLANPDIRWSQRQLAHSLCISLAEINAGLKRLIDARLLIREDNSQYRPMLAASEEFLICALKYLIPAKLGEYTRGIPTAVGAPLFQKKIALGSDPIPVWPDALGEYRGITLYPIHPAITKALRIAPDQAFYEMLILIDAIRSGRARERNIAIELLKKRIRHENT